MVGGECSGVVDGVSVVRMVDGVSVVRMVDGSYGKGGDFTE